MNGPCYQWWTFAIGLTLSIGQSWGVLDADGDQLPDLWQRQYPEIGQDAAGDYDGDGHANEAEARAGTDPTDAQSHFTLSWDSRQDMSWPRVNGKDYAIEASNDLRNWIVMPRQEIRMVAGRNQFTLTEDSDQAMRYLRVVASDRDDDADGLTSWEESLVGSDPLVQDTDGDGVWDGLEAQRGLDPNVPTPYRVTLRLRNRLFPLDPGQAARISSEPTMPMLEARFSPNLGPDVLVRWSMDVAYPPRASRDAIRLPEEGVWELPSSEWFELSPLYQARYFGGNARLRYQLGPQEETTSDFRILGENPIDREAKLFAQAQPGVPWYAWAILQHESRIGSRVYNQFYPEGTSEGEPVFGPPDGWGMAQLDSARGTAISTMEVWNWQSNVQSAVTQMKANRDRQVPAYFEAIQRTFPQAWEAPPSRYSVPGSTTVLTAAEASEIQLYNGAAVVRRLRSPFGGESLYLSAWAFDENASPGTRWHFVSNRNDYVRKVIINEVDGQAEIRE